MVLDKSFLDYLQSSVLCLFVTLPKMTQGHVAHLFPSPIRVALSQAKLLDFSQTCHLPRPRPVGLLGLINSEEISVYKHMHAGRSSWERTHCIHFCISESVSSIRQKEHPVCVAWENFYAPTYFVVSSLIKTNDNRNIMITLARHCTKHVTYIILGNLQNL